MAGPDEVQIEERPELLLVCGLTGLTGNLAPVVTLIWATFVAEHSFVADTISDLARQEVSLSEMSVHTTISFALAPLYLAGPLLMARAAARVSRLGAFAFLAASGVFTVFAVWFKLGPTAYDGILEKIAIGATLLWTLPPALFFTVRGLRKLSGRHPPDRAGVAGRDRGLTRAAALRHSTTEQWAMP